MPTAPRQYKPKSPGRKLNSEKSRRKKRPYNYNSKEWRDIRARQLSQQPLCEQCTRDGKVKPGSHVDHIDGNAWNNTSDNLQTLCHSCHSSKTNRMDGGFGNAKKAGS